MKTAKFFLSLLLIVALILVLALVVVWSLNLGISKRLIKDDSPGIFTEEDRAAVFRALPEVSTSSLLSVVDPKTGQLQLTDLGRKVFQSLK